MAPPPSRGFSFEIPALAVSIYANHQGLSAEVARTVSVTQYRNAFSRSSAEAEAKATAQAGLTSTEVLLPAAS